MRRRSGRDRRWKRGQQRQRQQHGRRRRWMGTGANTGSGSNMGSGGAHVDFDVGVPAADAVITVEAGATCPAISIPADSPMAYGKNDVDKALTDAGFVQGLLHHDGRQPGGRRRAEPSGRHGRCQAGVVRASSATARTRSSSGATKSAPCTELSSSPSG